MKHNVLEIPFRSNMTYSQYRRHVLDLCVIYRLSNQYLKLMRAQKHLVSMRYNID